jgi:peroxiredoxin (alkyl hydroperoxide reductase subunit C)
VANAVVDKEFVKHEFFRGNGRYTVLLFYPFDFTYVCPTELISFSDAAADFDEIDADIVGISTDSHFTHLAWINTPRVRGGLGDVNIPLVADISKDISRNYGVLVENPEDELYGAALRGLFIIDGNGIVRMAQINDAPVGRSVEETKRLVQAFQYTDEHGEVCPANWKPGGATIIPQQDKKEKYFAEEYKGEL